MSARKNQIGSATSVSDVTGTEQKAVRQSPAREGKGMFYTEIKVAKL